MEPFWDLKTSKYAEYLTCVSSEYVTSSACAVFSGKYIWLAELHTFSRLICNPMDKECGMRATKDLRNSGSSTARVCL